MLDLILKVLGLGGESSVVNKAIGAVNYLALAPVAIWLYKHREDILTFHIDVGTLALVVGAAFLLLELNRRN